MTPTAPDGPAAADPAGPGPERRPFRALEVDDPAALRALAHPARQRIIAELLAGRVMTATEAADLVGLTPSAVSHHLRALERYGVAERAEPAADGRTRPWRSRITELNFSARKGPGGAEAVNLVIQQELGHLSRNLNALVTSPAVDEPRLKGQLTFSGTETWLTDAESTELTDRLQQILHELPERHSANHPQDATRVQLVVSLVPVADGGTAATTPDPTGDA